MTPFKNESEALWSLREKATSASIPITVLEDPTGGAIVAGLVKGQTLVWRHRERVCALGPDVSWVRERCGAQVDDAAALLSDLSRAINPFTHSSRAAFEAFGARIDAFIESRQQELRRANAGLWRLGTEEHQHFLASLANRTSKCPAVLVRLSFAANAARLVVAEGEDDFRAVVDAGWAELTVRVISFPQEAPSAFCVVGRDEWDGGDVHIWSARNRR